MRRSLFCALALALAPPAGAQGGATWERLPDPADEYRTYPIYAFVPLPGLGADTLLVQASGLWALAPGGAAWARYDDPRYRGTASGYLRAASGALLGYDRGGVDASYDNGRTWAYDASRQGAACLYERPRDGAVLACGTSQADVDPFRVSTDDGRTWRRLGGPQSRYPDNGADGYSRSYPHALVEHPSAGPGGAPRLVTAGTDGAYYSDDGGATWAPSDLLEPYRWYGRALLVVPDPGAAGGHAVLAAVEDFAANLQVVVFASADGGATWAERHRFAAGSFGGWARTADGAVWLGHERAGPGLPVLERSGDGGRTWGRADGGLQGDESVRRDAASYVEAGPDGRLYVRLGGRLWRTTGPVVAVADGPGPSVRSRLVVRVFPNPAGPSATVAVRGAGGRRVRVAVLDVLGREVAVVHDGPATDEDRFSADLGALPPGTYVVRATVASEVEATAVLTVSR